MRLKHYCAVISIVAAAPAMAQVPQSAPAIVTERDAAPGDQLQAYSNWIEQMGAAFQMGQASVEAIQPKLAAALNSKGAPAATAEARAALANARSALRRSSAVVSALKAPAFEQLHLPSDLSAAAIQSGVLTLNANRTKMIDAMEDLLKALQQRDLPAALRANVQLLAAGGQQLDLLILLTKARAVASHDHVADRVFFEVVAIIYRGQRQMLRIATPAGLVADSKVSGDLDQLAAELELLLGRERPLLESAISLGDSQITDARARGADTSGLDLVQRIQVGARDLFPQGEAVAAALRETSNSLRRGTPTATELTAIIGRFAGLERALAQIQLRAIHTLNRTPLS
ncbi:hypothetical protein IAG41_03990 [Sphingomonas sp. JC676]|uniref:hypothetical protein n=1 Tax=Sphingomonas sp. JC676 TaxID=2768065 RepID=UPI001657A458|nr:hypothetical protein [Sphingomonas sp. JC676]MBC9031545.1 hypothetical protein [Sphingomonas sp. JC676]